MKKKAKKAKKTKKTPLQNFSKNSSVLVGGGFPYSDMLTACLAYAFGAVLYSCDMAKDSIFTKILCCRMMFFLVLHKSRKVVIGYIARGLVALNTFFVCNNQVIIQRRYICVALVTFSTIQSPLVKVHCFFMEFAMG